MMHDFDFNELFIKFRYPLLIFLVGAILVAGGFFLINRGEGGGTEIEVLGDKTAGQGEKLITVEIAGEILKPGVYQLDDDARINDLLQNAGGLSANADRVWVEKYLNKAAKLTDGQKVYIPKAGEQSTSSSAKTSGGDQSASPSFSSDSKGLININSASLSQLDTLPGIGQVYGQSIIEHRPYSNVEELLSKGVLKKSVYEKVKNLVSIY
jgi:competence protein ComEA